MKSMNPPAPWWMSAWLACLLVARLAGAEDWPKGYVPHEDAQSPDERYGILVPTYEAWDSNQASEEVNYFADLKEHRLLGKIKDADYFEHQNHRGLSSVWADDSSWCVTQYDDRFGFSTISIIEPKSTSFVQTEIGTRIKKGLAGAIQMKDSEGGDATVFYRIDSGKLSVRAASTTDPKEMDIKHARYAYFRGTFDVRSKKWLSSDARRLDYQAYDNASTALMDIDTDEEIPTNSDADDMVKSLDRIMNGVYEFLHAVLPPARFAAIKKEQVEWLKKRDAASTVQEKCKLLQGRIKTLQDLLW